MTFEEAHATALGPEGKRRLALWPERAEWLYRAAESVLHLDGEFWECGTYKGGSAKLLAELLSTSPRTLRLFDTFRGFTGITEKDGVSSIIKEGEMFYSEDAVEDVRQFVNRSFVSIHPGPVPSGFTGLESSRIAFVYLDMDLYQPTRDAMLFVLPRMVSGGMIVIDDCGDKNWPGVEIAVEETKGDLILQKASSQSPYDLYVGWQGRIQL